MLDIIILNVVKHMNWDIFHHLLYEKFINQSHFKEIIFELEKQYNITISYKKLKKYFN